MAEIFITFGRICNSSASNIRIYNPKRITNAYINAGGFFRPLGKKWQSLVANPPERNKVYSTITITNESGKGKLKFATKIDKFLYISLKDIPKSGCQW